MWARDAEIALGFWLLASPFVFGHGPGDAWHWASNLGAGLLVIVLGAASYWEPTRHAHAVTVFVGLCLAGAARLLPEFPPSPAFQNELVVGLLLIMFAILPNESSRPPRPWRAAGSGIQARSASE